MESVNGKRINVNPYDLIALPVGIFGFSPNPQCFSDSPAQQNVPHCPLDSNVGSSRSSFTDLLVLNSISQRGQRAFSSDFSKPNIRRKEKAELKALIRPGRLIQVCGAPLVGKSTLVKETLKELCCQEAGQNIIQHHVMCKGLLAFCDVLSKLYQDLGIKESPNQIAPAHQIQAAFVLGGWLNKHHIFAFHKCEAVKTNKEHLVFLDFLGELSQLSCMTVIFTTYKLFSRQSNCSTLEIGMLGDLLEIQALLNFSSRGNQAAQDPGYVSLILRYNLGFPLAVRDFAQMYLQGNTIPSPEEVTESMQKNASTFLGYCLGHRLSEVETWLEIDKLKWIVHFCHSMDGSCTEELLGKLTSMDDQSSTGWNEVKAHLADNFVLCLELGKKRLQFHPLVMLYFSKSLEARTLVLKGEWFNQSCNKVARFLCDVLEKTEMVSRCQGNKYALFQCLLPEWCNVKNAIQMAVYRNDYLVYWKVATMGANLLVKLSPNCAVDFFQAMVDNCRQNGFRSRKETAILEGCLAYALAQTGECSWKQARQHFSSAISVLRKENDCSFFTAQILCNLGRMLTRQGKYWKSTKNFLASQELLKKSFTENEDDQFHVSEWQRDELATSINIFQSIPKIFHGDNTEVLKSLHIILRDMENKNLYHTEYATILNLMGLTVQRGNGDLDRAIFYYRQSLEERMHLINVCPQEMVVPLNNLAMLQASKGQIDKALKNLHSALSIRRRHGWNNYYTALTVAHIGDIHIKLNDLVTALGCYTQADEISSISSKNHDIRLRLNLCLAHISLAIDKKHSKIKNSHPSQHQIAPSLKNALLTQHNKTIDCLNKCMGSCFENASESSADECDCKESLYQAFYTKKSPKYYFGKVDSLAKQLKGTLSDHGHGQLMSSLEHLILLEWGNPCQISKYLRRIEEIRATDSWIAEELKKPKQERKPFLDNHDQFFQYILSTDVSGLDLRTVIRLVQTNCRTCLSFESYFSELSWEETIFLFQNARKQNMNKIRLFNSEQASAISSISSLSASSFPHESPKNLNSLDLYMNINFNDLITGEFEDNSIDSNCKEKNETVRKFCESSDDSGIVFTGVNSTQHGCTAVRDCHLSLEESSWSLSHSLLLNGSGFGIDTANIQNNSTNQDSPTIPRNVSLPSESTSHIIFGPEMQLNSENNNNLWTASHSDLKGTFYQAYIKQEPRGFDNDFMKASSSSSTNGVSSVSMYAEEECYRPGRLASAESDYGSVTNSTVIGSNPTEKSCQSQGSYSTSSNVDMDSCCRHRDRRYFGHQENRVRNLPDVFGSPPDLLNINNSYLRRSSKSDESNALNDNLSVNSGKTDSTVSPAFCYNNNNDKGRLSGTSESTLDGDFSRLTLLCQGASVDQNEIHQHNARYGLDLNRAARHKRPTEQDERDVK